MGLKPGDVFTHRNIANIINPTDLSLLSVVEFSVRHLKVKHVVVCGHTSCGGVNATLANNKLGVLDLWLQPMRALREKHADELAKLEGADKSNHLAKLNVQAGVENLRRIPTVIEAMQERGLQLHGVIYDLATGLLEDLDCGEEEEVGKNRIAAFETK
jgi:carbonic anhydrase